MKAKFKGATRFVGMVNGTEVHATGRNKREAVKRIRNTFNRAGILTQPDAFTDLLIVKRPNDRQFHAADTAIKRLSRRERQVRNGKRFASDNGRVAEFRVRTFTGHDYVVEGSHLDL